MSFAGSFISGGFIIRLDVMSCFNNDSQNCAYWTGLLHTTLTTKVTWSHLGVICGRFISGGFVIVSWFDQRSNLAYWAFTNWSDTTGAMTEIVETVLTLHPTWRHHYVISRWSYVTWFRHRELLEQPTVKSGLLGFHRLVWQHGRHDGD